MSMVAKMIHVILRERGCPFETQQSMPLDNWPWRTPRSRQAPRSNIFLPRSGIHIEIKGLMTIYASAKMCWLSRQDRMRYYILQATEDD